MPKIADIVDLFELRIPSKMKMDFDNVGLLVGTSDAEVRKVLVSLDITDEVINEAKELKAELIVSHHPLFFELKSITNTTGVGRKVIELLTNRISAVCLHTNLDAADGGVNDVLMTKLGGKVTDVLKPAGEYPDGRIYGIGRIGMLLSPTSFERFLEVAKTSLNANGLRYHNAGRQVHKIACCGGSGGDELDAAAEAGCDTYVTADIKYNRFLSAKEYGINLIDGDHFCTENVIVPVIADMLAERFGDLEIKISEKHSQTA